MEQIICPNSSMSLHFGVVHSLTFLLEDRTTFNFKTTVVGLYFSISPHEISSFVPHHYPSYCSYCIHFCFVDCCWL